MRHRAPRFLLPSLASLAAVSLAFACGTTEVSIPDPARTDSGAIDAAVADTSAGDTSLVDAPIDSPPTDCPVVTPDDATGVYVNATAVMAASCGTRAAPCKTVSMGIAQATAKSMAKVYVARGTYVEKVALAAGIEVVGGWDIATAGNTWKRSCVEPGQAVVLRAPAAQNVTVSAANLAGEAGLTLLRIESKTTAQVAAGESLYGVVATGASTTVTMTDVTVEIAAAAGAGTSPAKSANGAPGAASCPAGTGVPGVAGSAGAGAASGSFDATGYTPAAPGAGGTATAGDNGTASATAPTCQACVTCAPFPDCTATPDPVGSLASCGKAGTSGCGGGPGVTGVAASGGGSSIGVYAWDATVTITGGRIKSGDAGNGGVGGAGGNGGAASAGVAGAAGTACTTVCGAADMMGGKCLPDTKAKGAGGTAGGAGGLGGAGGAGGGGGGGSSIATYQGNTGLITSPTTTLAHGVAGTGGGAGAPGVAADHVP